MSRSKRNGKNKNKADFYNHDNEARLSGVSDILTENYMPYAMSVIISRALPEIDGFKPSHRKLLYAMYKMGLMRGARAKSADIVGRTMALNPHGDQSIYETMVRMTKGNGALLHPYIDSKGNFGKCFSRDMQYAAYRYTEAKLADIAELIFSDLEKNAVDFVPNYSGTMLEPVLLPASIPTILLNANQGIAVGMASNICSFNLRELCALTEEYILKGEVEDPLKIMPCPDFSTGGSLVYEADQMRKIYETGRGSFKLRAEIEHNEKRRCFEIKEIPYTTSTEQITEELIKQAKDGKLKEIKDIRDETDLHGLSLIIEYKASADPEMLLKKLYHMSSLESSFSCNFNVLVDKKPRVMGVLEIIDEWCKWRRSCLLRVIAEDIKNLSAKLHLLRAIEKVLLDIDKAVAIIRKTEKESEVIPALQAAFEIDQEQAEGIAEIKLRHLNREYLLRKTEEISDLEEKIKDLEKARDNREVLNGIIVKDLKSAAKKYGQDRRTRIIEPEEEEYVEIEAEDLIEDYNVQFFFTNESFFKKVPSVSMRGGGEHRFKDGDFLVDSFEGDNKRELIFFTDKGTAYKRFAYEIEDSKLSDLGEPAANFLESEEDENIIFVAQADPEDYSGVLLFVFSDGQAVKLPLEAYKTKTKRRKLLNALYSGAVPVYCEFGRDENDFSELCLISEKRRRCITVSHELISLKSTRNSRGNKLMRLKKGDKVAKVVKVDKEDTEKYEKYQYHKVLTVPAAGKSIEGGPLSLSLLDLYEEQGDS